MSDEKPVRKGECCLVFDAPDEIIDDHRQKIGLLASALRQLLIDCPEYVDGMKSGIYKLSIRRMEDDEARQFIDAAGKQPNAAGVDHNSDKLFGKKEVIH